MAERLSLQKSIRPPTLADIPRLALVATAGFYDAPQFGWERPNHHQYPHDTYLSYCNLFATCISDPGSLVYLAEDVYDITEDDKTEATIDTGDLYQVPQSNGKVPVGVAIWKLPNESPRRGLTTVSSDQMEPSIAYRMHGAPQRDVNESHRAQLRSKVGSTSSKLFGPSEILYNMMVSVVHPAYRRKGHGKSLARLGAAYADIDKQAIRLVAQSAAVRLYQSVGFEILDQIRLEDENEHFELTAMIRQPSTGTTS